MIIIERSILDSEAFAGGVNRADAVLVHVARNPKEMKRVIDLIEALTPLRQETPGVARMLLCSCAMLG